VTILAILALIGGIFSVIAGLGALGFGGIVASATGSTQLGTLVVIGGVLLVVTGAIDLLFAYGAWTLQGWGWALGIIGQLATIVVSIILVVGGSSITSQVIGVAIAIVILYYLNQPHVKAAFGRS
jgi:hypothetical protein